MTIVKTAKNKNISNMPKIYPYSKNGKNPYHNGNNGHKKKHKKRKICKQLTQDQETFLEFLSYKRPHGSLSEKQFIARYIDTIENIEIDNFGNRILTIGENPNILWSCHTDTVHHTEGRQKLYFEQDTNIIFGNGKDCIGADNGSGIWVLLQLIKANIPGLYIFHRAEESGGLGSQHIVDNRQDLLHNIDHAIAFDRHGNKSTITHQIYGRSCSDSFAYQLSDILKMDHVPDDTGVFTDTAFYASIISECTNVSSGFNGAHSKQESLDYDYMNELIKTLIDNWQKIVNILPERDPMDDHDQYDCLGWNGRAFSDYSHDDMFQDVYGVKTRNNTLLEMVKTYPEIASNILHDMGITEKDF